MTDIVFQNASILDTRAGELWPGAVRVEHERSVEVTDGPIRHAGVREIDLRGRFAPRGGGTTPLLPFFGNARGALRLQLPARCGSATFPAFPAGVTMRRLR